MSAFYMFYAFLHFFGGADTQQIKSRFNCSRNAVSQQQAGVTHGYIVNDYAVSDIKSVEFLRKVYDMAGNAAGLAELCRLAHAVAEGQHALDNLVALVVGDCRHINIA